MKRKQRELEQPVVEQRKPPGVDVAALTSRWDYGSEGSRVGLLQQLKERIEEAKADFLVLVGGIVSRRAVYQTVRKIREKQIKKHKKLKEELDKLNQEIALLKRDLTQDNDNKALLAKLEKKRGEVGTKAEQVERAKPRSLKELLKIQEDVLARQINSDLPKLQRSDGKRMRIYIVTSQAYDGEIGRNVVKKLLELRRSEDDIRYLSNPKPETTTFNIPLQKSGKSFKVVVPNKAQWRSKYYSTAPDRLLEDEVKRTSQELADVYAVGCFASSLNRPDGEIPYQRITVPALHKLEDVITAENMVGIRIVRFVPNERVSQVLTVDFKDLVSQERRFVNPPAKCSKVQLQIIEEIKKKGARSLGLLEDALGVARSKLEKALSGLLGRKVNAGMYYDDESRNYDFSPEWFQRMVRYVWPKDDWQKEVLAGYGCIHGGSVHTAYKFIVRELPIMLHKHGVNYLLAVGDLIEGLKHNLAIRGEVYAGMNNTSQEKLIAFMTAEVILKVFDLNLAQAFQGKDVKKLNADELSKTVNGALMTFLYWVGNHDAWAEDLGYDPLDTFESNLRELLLDGAEKVLGKHGIANFPVRELVEKKIVKMHKGKPYTLPSGLKVDGAHYFAGRTQTSSTWCQRALNQLCKAQLLWIANFHVAEIVEEWDAELGLRVAMQLPTLKSKSSFEENKGKITDFGVGLLKVWSRKGRVMVSETSFLGTNPNESLSNKDIVRALLKDIGVGQYVDLNKIR